MRKDTINYLASLLRQRRQRRLAERWQAAAQSGRTLAIDEEMSHITLEIVGKALLSLDLSGATPGFGEAFQQANQSFSLRNFAYT